jgi:alkyl hydroperoxide reductase subunit AhpC
MAVYVQKVAPEFTATAVVGGEFKEVRLSDYRGKYVVFFFYPLDWTFVCPTEIIAFSDQIAEFENATCKCSAVRLTAISRTYPGSIRHASKVAWAN